MKILAIESSCDETAAAIVENGRRVFSNIVASQVDLHTPYGGVIPEMAAREHLVSVPHVVSQALADAGLQLDEIDAFAATLGPGLIGSLLIGAQAARTLSALTGKPFIGVHHLQAHVASNYLDSPLEPPFVCLLVSGGHTQLLSVRDYSDIVILGETLDDAVGEAYDKLARLLGLGYPGGPKLDALAKSGNPLAFDLPDAKCQNPLDFSFSGLKTAVVKRHDALLSESGTSLSTQQKADLAASFQARAVKTLLTKTLQAAEDIGVTTLAVAGGVAANSALRDAMADAAEARPGWQFYRPEMAYCTDNAAMVGAAAYFCPLPESATLDVFSRGLPVSGKTSDNKTVLHQA